MIKQQKNIYNDVIKDMESIMEFNMEEAIFVHRKITKHGVKTLYRMKAGGYILQGIANGNCSYISLDDKKAFTWLMHSCTNKVTIKHKNDAMK
jgi:predicted transcriptional regulator of viral defense system